MLYSSSKCASRSSLKIIVNAGNFMRQEICHSRLFEYLFPLQKQTGHDKIVVNAFNQDYRVLSNFQRSIFLTSPNFYEL